MSSTVSLKIEEIKAHFMLEDSYERQDVLQDKVIKPAVADINKHSDMTVSYKVVKQGRKVSGFEFTYVCTENKNRKPRPKKAPTVKPAEAPDNLKHFANLRKQFGDKAPIPKEFEEQLKALGLW
jgi:plasmid replication initiation protein